MTLLTPHQLTKGLRQITSRVGHIEFGFTAQALLALSYRRIGAVVIEVNHSGHPDISIEFMNAHCLVEVEALSWYRKEHEIKMDDLVATRRDGSRTRGYIILLSLHFPAAWVAIDASRLYAQGPSSYPVPLLKSMSDSNLSKQLTEATCEIVDELGVETIANLGFRGLSDRAIRGQ